ncbi:MAG: tol-pal system protein YbgF [Bosea sp. (in: a-proteobacteria)]
MMKSLRIFSVLAALMLAVAASMPLAFAQDAAEAVVRLNRMENQMRQMSGQIEQLQFENRRLTEQLRKFQEDTEFRLSGQKPQGGAAPRPAQQPRPRQSDAFDPAAQPGSPSAPRNLASAPAGSNAAIEADGPLDLSGVARPVPGAPLDGGAAPRGTSSVAAVGGGGAREIYDAAYAAYQRKEFPQAEMGFRQLLQSFPRDRLASDATFWLGESYYQRGRHREAAEQFLRVTTDFPRTARAPDGLLKLGMSLNALGAKDQACSTYAKVERDYPQASTRVRQGVEREQKRARCTA